MMKNNSTWRHTKVKIEMDIGKSDQLKGKTYKLYNAK